MAEITGSSLRTGVDASLQQVGCVITSSDTVENFNNSSCHQDSKIPDPKAPVDFRLISVVPKLSRLVERTTVRSYLYPAFNSSTVSVRLGNICAFRPVRSTPASIIALLQHISSLLLNSEFVAVINMHYSSAFDAILHSSLMTKLKKLDISDRIHNWFINYFQDRGHTTRFTGMTSYVAFINAA